MPELVALIIGGFTQFELVPLLTLSRACLNESLRLMHRTPALVNLKKGDGRLAAPTRALKTRQGRTESFALGCRQ